MNASIITRARLTLCLIATLSLTGIMNANENVYDSGILSTVYIEASDGAGSGVLIDKEQRLVVTNEHVVAGSQEVVVLFPVIDKNRVISDKSWYGSHVDEVMIHATVISVDRERDIALLQLESVPDHVRAIEIGDSARPGQIVHSIGNPGSSDALWVYTNGHVRANYFKDFGDNRMQVVETQSPINYGDSGGPMLNDEGQLVGISQSFMPDDRLVSNGVDISEITDFVDHTLQSVDREGDRLIAQHGEQGGLAQAFSNKISK
ncbi:MAG: S1C family serine protease [Pirellulaceae bacterium]